MRNLHHDITTNQLYLLNLSSHTMKKYFISSLLALTLAWPTEAKVTLPAFFTDNMVLQQTSSVTFRGKANAGKTVRITTSWNDQTYTAQAGEDGAWTASIPTPEAGGPYEITFSDGKKLTLKNIMIGEVWFCSGQSNMEMPLAGWGKVQNYEAEIAAADYPQIRLFQVKKNHTLSPQDELQSTMDGWQECSPATVPEFSSAAYFYARALWKKLGVAIGVIDCTWGGTPAEAWTSHPTLKHVAGFEEVTAKLEECGFDTKKMDELYLKKHAEWYEKLDAMDKGMDHGKALWSDPTADCDNWKKMTLPTQWELAGLEGFDGVVWFRRTVDIPKSWEGQDITLHLGPVDDEDYTYFNGTEVAHGTGFAVGRTYTIPAELVKAGKATLTVRVIDTGGEGGLWGKADEMYMESEKGERIAINGEWLYSVGTALNGMKKLPDSPAQSANYPTVLFNAMVHPWKGFPVKGVIWYQGEANADRAAQYTRLFPALIADWRGFWQQKDLPFYFVQLANYMQRKEVQPDSHWAFLREAQANALHLDHTGMAVAIDIGLANDIHPKDKQEVGRRLSLLALAHTYGKDVQAEAPVCQSWQIKDNCIELTFNTDQFQVKGDGLKGFIIAGPDGKFHSAQAEIKEGKIMVSSPQVSMPQAVRYGWADNPECTLYGTNGLPVAPFRTDKW